MLADRIDEVLAPTQLNYEKHLKLAEDWTRHHPTLTLTTARTKKELYDDRVR